MSDPLRPELTQEFPKYIEGLRQAQVQDQQALLEKEQAAAERAIRQKALASELEALKSSENVKELAKKQEAAQQAAKDVQSVTQKLAAAEKSAKELAEKQTQLASAEKALQALETLNKNDLASEQRLLTKVNEQKDALKQTGAKAAEDPVLTDLQRQRKEILERLESNKDKFKKDERAAAKLKDDVSKLEKQVAQIEPGLKEQLQKASDSLQAISQEIEKLKQSDKDAAAFAEKLLAQQKENEEAQQLKKDIEKLQASLAKYSKQIKVNQPVLECQGKAEAREKVAHGGECHTCKQSPAQHFLDRSPEARKLVKELHDSIDQAAKDGDPGKVGLTPGGLKEMAEGTMIGVMVCCDQDGNKVILQAFSGAAATDPLQTTWSFTEGGVKKVVDFNGKESMYDRDNDQIDNMVGACAAQKLANFASTYEQRAQALREERQKALANALRKLNPYQANLEAAQEKLDYEKNALQKHQQELKKLEGPGIAKAQAEKMLRNPNYAKSEEGQRLKKLLDSSGGQLDSEDGQKMFSMVRSNVDAAGKELYEKNKPKPAEVEQARNFLKDFEKYKGLDGLKKLAAESKEPDATAHRKAAERLSALAASIPPEGVKGPLVPVGMAEMWFGAPSDRSFPPKVPGHIYDSCETCKSTLGTALCGLEEQRKKIKAKHGEDCPCLT